MEMLNKKGFVLTSAIIFTIAAVIGVAILLGLFVFSDKYKWFIIGIGILVGAFMLLMNAFKSDGDLHKGKMTIVLVLLSFAVLAVFYGNTLNVTFTGTVSVPIYGHVICNRLPVQVQQPFDVNSGGTTLTCGSPGTGNGDAYIPYGCTYTTSGKVNYKSCSSTDSCTLSGAQCLSTSLLQTGGTVKVNYGDKVTFNPCTVISTRVSMILTGDAYGLQIEESGKLLYKNNCDIRNLNLDYIPGKLDTSQTDNGFILKPTLEVANYIIGSTSVQDSKNVVTYNNKLIYIYNAGQYYNVVTSENGNKYVDESNPQVDNNIKCMPSTLYCTQVGNTFVIKTPTTGKTCSASSGNVEEYVQVNSNKVCKFACTNGILTQTTDCKTILSCTGDKPFFNPTTGVCEGGGVTPNNNLVCSKWYQESGTKTTVIHSWYNWIGVGTPTTVVEPACQTASWLPLALGGIVILILGTTLIVIWRPKRSNSRKTK